MPYIGRDLNRGNYLKLDDISSSFNSSTKTFNLTVGGSAFTPGSAFSILVSLGGVIQEPESAYQVSNSEITFANAPTAQDSFFCIALGVALGIGVPGSGTVNGPQMAKPFNYDGYFYLDDTNNRVGIGSLIPTSALDIIGDVKVSGNITGIGGTLGGTLIGNVHASSGISTFYDLKVTNNLTVEGTTTTLDTDLIGVDRVEVAANSNSIVGVAVTQSGTADILRLYDGTSQVVTVADDGKVGIGSDNPQELLSIMANGPCGVSLIDSGHGQAATTIKIGNTGKDLSVNVPEDVLYTLTNGNYKVNANGSERLRIKGSDGSVGIGTASPDTRLHVYGSSATEKLITISGGAHSRNNYIGVFQSDNLEIGADEDNQGGDSSIRFRVDGSEKVRITNDAKVGINTTVDAATQLQVQSDGTSTTVGENIVARFQSNGSGRDATIQLSDNVAHSATISMLSSALVFKQSGTETFRISSNGQTTVNSTANQPLILNNTNDNGQSSISFQSAGSTKYNLGSNKESDGNIDFFIYDQVNNEHRFNIKADGNVGINSSNPQEKLDVHGVGIITGGIITNVSPAITIRDGTTEKGYIGFNANDPFIGRKNGVGLLFQDNKVRPVVGDSGIGTNNTVDLGEPTYKFKDLYLEGDIHIDSDVGQLRIGADEDLKIDHNGSNAYFMNGTGSTLHRSADHIFENAGGSTEYVRIGSTGKVGISSTNPTSLLTVGARPNAARSSHPTALISPTSGNASLMLRGNSPTIDFDSTGGGIAQVCTDNAALIVSAGTFEDTTLNAGEMVRITSDGDVGIGSTNPHRTLILRAGDGDIHCLDGNGGIYMGTDNTGGFQKNCAIARAGAENYHIAGSTSGDLCIAGESGQSMIFGVSHGVGAMDTFLHVSRLRNFNYYGADYKFHIGSTETVSITSTGQTLLTRGSQGGRDSTGNASNFMKIGTWYGIDQTSRLKITIFGTSTYDSNADVAGETIIYISNNANNTMKGHFHSYSNNRACVQKVAFKMGSGNTDAEVWIKYNGGYSCTQHKVDASEGYWVGADVDTGSTSVPSGATEASSFFAVATSDGSQSYERLRITSGGQLNLAGNMQFTVGNPELEFNNGGPRFRVPAANTLAIHNGGTLGSTNNEAIRIDSSARVLIGTNNTESYHNSIVNISANTSKLLELRSSGSGVDDTSFVKRWAQSFIRAGSESTHDILTLNSTHGNSHVCIEIKMYAVAAIDNQAAIIKAYATAEQDAGGGYNFNHQTPVIEKFVVGTGIAVGSLAWDTNGSGGATLEYTTDSNSNYTKYNCEITVWAHDRMDITFA